MSDTTKILLSLAAVAVAMFGGKALESAKRLFAGGGGAGKASAPTAATFVNAVSSLDVAVAYLRASGQYGESQEAAAKAIRAAIVAAATPKADPVGVVPSKAPGVAA